MYQLLREIEATYGKETGERIRNVCTVVYSKVKNGNLYGWRWFIEDVVIELATYMLKDNLSHPQGGYIMCGMQSALDHARKCSALKRRGDYELVSLDNFFQVADEPADETPDTEEFLFDVEMSFGPETRDELEPFVLGQVDRISGAVRKKLHTPEFQKFLKERMSK